MGDSIVRCEGVCLQSRSSGVQFSAPPPEFVLVQLSGKSAGLVRSVIGARIAAARWHSSVAEPVHGKHETRVQFAMPVPFV